MAGLSRREQRRAKGKASSLLDGLEDDFLDIEENFKAPIAVESKTTQKVETGNKPTTIKASPTALATPIVETDNKVATPGASATTPKKSIVEVDAKEIIPAPSTTLDQAQILIPAKLNDDPKQEDKLATNREQSDNTNSEKWQQSSNTNKSKATTNREQTDNKEKVTTARKAESGNKVGTQPTTLSATNWGQSDNKPATKQAFSSLVGLQRNLIIFIYNACKVARSKSTEALTLEHMAKTLETSTGSVKTTLQRLEKKSCINRLTFKNGRGGWSKYELAEGLYSELLQLETENKLATNWQQSDSKLVAKSATEPTTSSPSSSSYLNINTTTNYKADALENLPSKWKIEIPKILREQGFTDGHIDQLARDAKFGFKEVEESLAAFAFDLGFDDVKRQIRRPVAMFLALLKRGEPYVSQKGYISDEDRLIQENIERLKKAREEKKKRAEELLNLKFDEWVASKSKEELIKFVAPFTTYMDIFHKQALKDYFVENEIRSPEGELQ